MLEKSDLPAKQLNVEIRIALRDLCERCKGGVGILDVLEDRLYVDRGSRLTKKQRLQKWNQFVEEVSPVTIRHARESGGKYVHKGAWQSVLMLDVGTDIDGSFDLFTVSFRERDACVSYGVKLPLRISRHALEQVIRRTNEIGLNSIGGVLSCFVGNMLEHRCDDDEWVFIDRRGYVGVLKINGVWIVKTYIAREQFHARRREHLKLAIDHIDRHGGSMIVRREQFDLSYSSGQPLTVIS